MILEGSVDVSFDSLSVPFTFVVKWFGLVVDQTSPLSP